MRLQQNNAELAGKELKPFTREPLLKAACKEQNGGDKAAPRAGGDRLQAQRATKRRRCKVGLRLCESRKLAKAKAAITKSLRVAPILGASQGQSLFCHLSSQRLAATLRVRALPFLSFLSLL